MRLNIVFCKALQQENVIFLFSIKQYLLMVKTTDVNNSLYFLHGMNEIL